MRREGVLALGGVAVALLLLLPISGGSGSSQNETAGLPHPGSPAAATGATQPYRAAEAAPPSILSSSPSNVYDRLRALATPSAGISAQDPTTLTWTNLTVPRLPPAVAEASMAFDASRAVSILFGGATAQNVALNTTWSYDSRTGQWTELALARAPPARSGAGMAYDPVSGDLLLFGGYLPAVPGAIFGDCWLLPPTGPWTPCPTMGQGPALWPAARLNPTLVSDPAMGGVVMYGGQNTTGSFGDTWLWTAAGGWLLLQPTGSAPRAVWGMEGATLPGNGGILVYGGAVTSHLGDKFYFDAYELSPSSVWTNVGSVPNPGGMTGGSALGAMAYVPALAGVVLYGGAYSYDTYTATTYASEQTWVLSWNGSNATHRWSELAVQNISGEAEMASDYDTGLGAMLVFGGVPTTSGTLPPIPVHTEFDQFSAAVGWMPAFNATTPPALGFPSVAYDTSNGDLLVFGGITSIDASSLTVNATNETWVFTPAGSWVLEHPQHAPPQVAGATLEYLPAPMDEFVLFGGFTYYHAINETWYYRVGGDWTNATGGVAPPPRATSAVALAPGGDDFYLFGGFAGCSQGLPGITASRFFGDTWEFTPSGWRNLTTGGAPRPRAGSFLVPSSVPGIDLLAGGTGPQSPGCVTNILTLDDQWAFNTTDASWQQLPHFLNSSAPVFGCATYDPMEHEDLYGFGISGIRLLAIGYSNSTWRAGSNLTFDRAAQWSPLAGTQGEADWAPSARATANCVYDPLLQGTFLFGGLGQTGAGPYSLLRDSWLLRDVAWSISVPTPQEVVNASFTLNLSALDPFGALAPRNATLFLSDTTGTISPSTATLVEGKVSLQAVVRAPAASDRVEACGLGICVNLTVEVASPPVRLVLSGLPSTITAGSPTPITVEVVNASGDAVPTWKGNSSLAVPGGVVVPSQVTLAAGVGSTNVRFLRAGTGLSLWAQASALGTSQGPFTVVPSYLSVLNVTPRPSTVLTGGWLSLEVKGSDAYGNPVSGSVVALSDALGDLKGTTATLENGSLAVQGQVGAAAGTDTVAAISGNVSGSAPLTVDASPVPPNPTPTARTNPAPFPWYLVVLAAAAMGLLAGLLLLAELRRRERATKRKGGKKAREASSKEPSKEKAAPSGFLAFIPAEEEEEESGPPEEGGEGA
ncbi:MAG: hypothetical protein KGI89_07540 [Euryarchaeota archaeon]|nr:hypothetical protein [Euryarchaeota archaeon]